MPIFSAYLERMLPMSTAIATTKQKTLEAYLTEFGYTTILTVLPIILAEVNETSSGRVYKQDIKAFVLWMHEAEIDVLTISRVDLQNYRKYLNEQGKSNITINRMFSVVRVVIAELVDNGTITTNPLEKKFKPLPTNDETTHVALDDRQAKQLLDAINTSTIKRKRDYAMISLMLRSGIRREEIQKLNIGDIKMKQGHHVVDIKDGKGGKPATVKIAPDVWCYLNEYMQSLQEKHPRRDGRLEAPLFISLRKGDNPSLRQDKTGKLIEQRIDIKAIETTVKSLGNAIGVIKLTPHGLRATFITLAMEHNATLEQTQYAARHKDPRTTERYRKRKLNLDNNAVDKLSFLAREEDSRGNASWDTWEKVLKG
jgi:integrase/recombinase XerD